jgi:hypothetical protein
MKTGLVIVAAALLSAACGSNANTSAPATNAPDKTFVDRVDNPWFPLTPGTTLIYRGVKDGEPTRDVVTVTNRTKLIQGVRCTVVRDLLYLNGKLAERTSDWYAQDAKGNVWYYGEATAELDPKGRVKSTEGSWQSGVHGARAGMFMPAQPRVGQSFRQEYFKGQAEDHFQILSLNASVKVPYTSSKHALLTKEWTPLEPDVLDHKLYVRGIGNVKEQTVKGPNERLVLVAVRRG